LRFSKTLENQKIFLTFIQALNIVFYFKDNEDFMKKITELKVWAKLDCDYFVQYRSSWVEIYDEKLFQEYWESLKTIDDTNSGADETDFGENPIHAFLHIQMDFCPFTLKDAMTKVNEELNIGKGQTLNPIGFYIAGELLVEILESIDFLHKQNIIHRDLKPQNILVSNGANGRYIKIADFGIATPHSGEQSHTQLRGTLKYMAPEVLNSRKYDTKADIYSIGVITQEMFNIDINK
jgi:serine/threonine protein kinase